MALLRLIRDVALVCLVFAPGLGCLAEDNNLGGPSGPASDEGGTTAGGDATTDGSGGDLPTSGPTTSSATGDATTGGETGPDASTSTASEPPGECGDGVVGGDEACDDGDDNGPGMACHADCTLNACGDGDQGPAETCDDGNQDGGDGCSAACAPEVCGNGVVDPGEACDDGANGQDDGCTDGCALPACGDGVVQASVAEECDLGADNADMGACTTSCKDAACGDGFVWAGVEACDEGADNGNDKLCRTDCLMNECGDGFVWVGFEACDDGNDVDEDACTSACVPAECGDGFVQPGEACDDGPDNADDAVCTLACMDAVCGDGLVQAGVEACDDGNQADMDACLGDCTANACGDGLLNVGVEACDDGNMVAMDGCGPTCLVEQTCVVEKQAIGQNIPDDGYNGMQGSMACVDLMCAVDGAVGQVVVYTGLTHTRVGDLTLKLYSPNDAATLAIMSRPGTFEANDMGANNPTGDSSNLDKMFPVTFRDGGMKSAEDMADILGNNAVACKDDNRCDYFPNKGAAAGLNNFAGFAGSAAAGTWKFCVGDSAPGDVGAIDMVRLSIFLN